MMGCFKVLTAQTKKKQTVEIQLKNSPRFHIFSNMNLLKYSLIPPIKYDSKTILHRHTLYTRLNRKSIVPLVFDENTINPNNFLKLKIDLRIHSITIVDRVKPKQPKAYIANHVNRSGYNFLIGKTPIQSYSRFPDMTNIYNTIPGLRPISVHTVGPKRFDLKLDTTNVISESVGLIAPIWHYIGIKVFAQNFKD